MPNESQNLPAVNFYTPVELAHLRVSNHSQEFWNIVSVQVPMYEDAKNWLREKGNLIEVDF